MKKRPRNIQWMPKIVDLHLNKEKIPKKFSCLKIKSLEKVINKIEKGIAIKFSKSKLVEDMQNLDTYQGIQEKEQVRQLKDPK